MLVLIFFALLLRGSVVQSSLPIENPRFYIYDWPEAASIYAKYTDRDIGLHGVEFPRWEENFGAGRSIDPHFMEYKTSQFSLYKLMYERALIDPRRTLKPEEATTFVVPYDIGMDACFTHHGRMRQANCKHGYSVIQRLNESTFFHRNNGHDHVMFVSVNQNMNYFFFQPNCSSVFNFCWNCTKLAIDEYLFTAQDRIHELRGRGINWHAIPFPSDYHYLDENKNNIQPHWESPAEYGNKHRKHIVSFSGNTQRLNKYSTRIREALVRSCSAINSTDICTNKRYNTGAGSFTSIHSLSRNSIFCLQPPGDMPTRKSVFDGMLSGCINIYFHPLTAKYMYEWHLSASEWDSISINYDTIENQNEIMSGEFNVVEKLVDFYKKNQNKIREMQENLRKLAFRVQFSAITVGENGKRRLSRRKIKTETGSDMFLEDAYDISIRKVLEIHAGKASHNRSTTYIECHANRKRLRKEQTSDKCSSLDTIVDPYSPPALVDVFLKNGVERI